MPTLSLLCVCENPICVKNYHSWHVIGFLIRFGMFCSHFAEFARFLLFQGTHLLTPCLVQT